VGSPSAPDYYFIGGSFLSGVALGDIADPSRAPIVGDLAKGYSTAYINDNGTNDLTMAADMADLRHNKGAVFAFVDGHCAWVKKTDCTPLLFVPSVVSGPMRCANLGPVSPAAVGWAAMPALLRGQNLTTLLAMGSASNNRNLDQIAFVKTDVSGNPGSSARNSSTMELTGTSGISWIKCGAGSGTKVDWGNSYTTANNTYGHYWSTASSYTHFPIMMAIDTDTAVHQSTITLMPNVTEGTTKKMAVIVLQRGDTAISGQVAFIKLLTSPTPRTDVRSTRISTNGNTAVVAQANLFLLSVQPDTPIEITLAAASGGSGHPVQMFLAFEP
jgi:prepilin-type processing-associated H-X9-DG protein